MDNSPDIGDRSMIGSYPSAKALGLESCDDAVVELYTYVDPDTSAIIGSDQIVVCLPKVTTSSDTMYILTDCMELNDNLDAGLKFVDDKTGSLVDITGRVDSAGYRYRSFWVSNTSYNKPTLQIRYNRIYPGDSTFIWWDGETPDCKATFNNYSLYAIGGSLSVDCSGALAPIPDIDNSFFVSTDTTIRDTVRATKLIIADEDPTNTGFSDSLETDIVRAIAWVEYAGSNDGRHCRPYHTQWNNYWDHVTSGPGQETCYETLYPCENIGSTATGTMQMLRSVWEPVFNGSREHYQPQGFYICSWDSLAWNWKLNIFNGKWIYFTDTFYHINLSNNPQRNWDSLCTCDPSEAYPDSPNKEDLATYGYHLGTTKMTNVTKDNWEFTVQIDTYYVAPVRMAKYRREWQ